MGADRDHAYADDHPPVNQKVQVMQQLQLDTLEVAARVRKMQSMINVGQRFLAEHVLGVAQVRTRYAAWILRLIYRSEYRV